MSLKVYKSDPFVAGTEVDQDDFYTGDGTTTAFVLSRKAVGRLASTVQFDATQYYQSDGGFARTDDGFETDTAPPFGSQGVAPGLTGLLFDQLFDASSVPGVSQPLIQEIAGYIAAPTTAPLYTFHPVGSAIGIEISMVNMITAAGAELSWVQLASAAGTEEGLALTYAATGASLYTAALQAYGSMLASTVSGASSIMVDRASDFYVGDYILINGGMSTQEVAKIIGYSAPTTLTLSGTNFDHYVGEVVYTCGRKFWIKCTVPIGAAQGQPQNFFNLALRTYNTKRARL